MTATEKKYAVKSHLSGIEIYQALEWILRSFVHQTCRHNHCLHHRSIVLEYTDLC